MLTDFDTPRIEALLAALCERAQGEWLLIGGALVALWLSPRRTTGDIDLIGLKGTAEERHLLLQLTSDLGLPIESVNSAADFFVHRIAGWRDQLAPYRQGTKGTVYRPTPTLFLLLKIGRLSEQDLDDCRKLIERAHRDSLPIDSARVRAALAALPPALDPALADRRALLLGALPADP